MNNLRFGLVGAGQIAEYAAGDIKRHGDATLTAVFDTATARAQDLATKQGIATVHPTAEALFADPNVDAVYIAVPNKFHAPLAEAALKAGKHVLLDKPFALNAGEAERVVLAAKASGKTFALGMNQRFAECNRRMRALVASGALGEVYHAKACWMRRWGTPKQGTWFNNKALAGGGGLLDIGVHALDVCLHILGNFSPESVLGATYTKFGNRGLGEGGWGKSDKDPSITFDVDDFASAFIKLKGGQSVTLDATWAAMQFQNDNAGIQLFGTEAGARTVNWQVELVRRTPAGEWVHTENPAVGELPYSHGCRFANFINAVLGREALITTPEEALAVQRILDGIYASSASGQAAAMGGR